MGEGAFSSFCPRNDLPFEHLSLRLPLEYNGFTPELRKRFRGRLLYNIAYTLGKVTDTTPDATAVVPNSDDAKFPSNPFDFNADDAPGNNDQRHRLVFSGLWDLNYWKDSTGLKKGILGGWSVSWIAAWQTGQPYSKIVTKRHRARQPQRPAPARHLHRRPAGRQAHPPDPRHRPRPHRRSLQPLRPRQHQRQRSAFYTYDVARNLLVPQANFGQDIGAADNRIVQLAAKITF